MESRYRRRGFRQLTPSARRRYERPRPAERRRDEIETLREVSVSTRVARRSGDRSTAIDVVQRELRNAREPAIRAILQRWQIDDAVAADRPDEALDRIRALVGQFGDVHFAGAPWAARVGSAEVRLLDRADAPDVALRRCRELAAKWPNEFDAATALFDLARSAERRGDTRAAHALYESVVRSSPDEDPGPSLPDLARGMQRRLRGAPWSRSSVGDLRKEVLSALRSVDAGALARLASGANFFVGPRLGEPALVAGANIARWLSTALRQARRADIVERTDESGTLWIGIVDSARRGTSPTIELGLRMVRARAEWDWLVVTGGVQSAAVGDLWSFLKGCETNRTESPTVVLPLKAPWPAGLALSAGGFTGGLYYNQAPTHCAESAFAIDFANGLDTYGIDVLAVHQGLVTTVRSDTDDFDDYTANVVYCDLVPDAGSVVVLLQLLFGGEVSRTRYDARYYHLRGPDQIPVSEGMWVGVGTKLGEFDSTGRSAASHLHFELLDRTENRHTVMPTPMDGVDLGLDDGGALITSSNEEQP